MASSLYTASIPVFQQILTALSGILDKAGAYCETKKVKEDVLTGTRLAPDMFAFARQVQIACDHAKNGPSRVAGIEPPRFEDTEVTIAELKTRIARTLEFLKTIDAATIDANAEKRIEFGVGPTKKAEMGATAYLHHWVLPNFFFHVTSAYAILRTSGLDVGKSDFLGPVPDFKWL
jgi:hypothetical protein